MQLIIVSSYAHFLCMQDKPLSIQDHPLQFLYNEGIKSILLNRLGFPFHCRCLPMLPEFSP